MGKWKLGLLGIVGFWLVLAFVVWTIYVGSEWLVHQNSWGWVPGAAIIFAAFSGLMYSTFAYDFPLVGLLISIDPIFPMSGGDKPE